MEVKIGVKHVTRELVLESSQSPDEVAALVADAVSNKTSGALTLMDEKGRRVVVPIEALAYVEIAEAGPRRVGFGAS